MAVCLAGLIIRVHGVVSNCTLNSPVRDIIISIVFDQTNVSNKHTNYICKSFKVPSFNGTKRHVVKVTRLHHCNAGHVTFSIKKLKE